MALSYSQPLNLFFEKAGIFILTPRNADGSLVTDSSQIYVSNDRVVKSIQYTASKETTDIESGNSSYPVDSRVKKNTGKLEVTLNAFDRQLYRFATGAKIEEVANGYITIANNYTISETGEIVFENQLYAAGKVVVKASTTEKTYTQATGDTPTSDEYKVDTAGNKLVFNASEKGKVVVVVADFEGETTADIIGKVPGNTAYQLKVIGKVGQMKATSEEMLDNIIFDSVKFDGEIKPPARQNEAAKWSVSFTTVEPVGNNVMEWKYIPVNKVKMPTP